MRNENKDVVYLKSISPSLTDEIFIMKMTKIEIRTMKDEHFIPQRKSVHKQHLTQIFFISFSVYNTCGAYFNSLFIRIFLHLQKLETMNFVARFLLMLSLDVFGLIKLQNESLVSLEGLLRSHRNYKIVTFKPFECITKSRKNDMIFLNIRLLSPNILSF